MVLRKPNCETLVLLNLAELCDLTEPGNYSVQVAFPDPVVAGTNDLSGAAKFSILAER
jgi:hypothetical protein